MLVPLLLTVSDLPLRSSSPDPRTSSVPTTFPAPVYELIWLPTAAAPYRTTSASGPPTASPTVIVGPSIAGPAVLLRTSVPSLTVVLPAYRFRWPPENSTVPAPPVPPPDVPMASVAPVCPVSDAVTLRSVAAPPSLTVSVRPAAPRSTLPARVAVESAPAWA